MAKISRFITHPEDGIRLNENGYLVLYSSYDYMVENKDNTIRILREELAEMTKEATSRGFKLRDDGSDE